MFDRYPEIVSPDQSRMLRDCPSSLFIYAVIVAPISASFFHNSWQQQPENLLTGGHAQWRYSTAYICRQYLVDLIKAITDDNDSHSQKTGQLHKGGR